MASLLSEILTISHSTQRYKRGFVKNTRAIEFKIQEKHMTSTSLLMFSPEFNLKRELYNISVLSSHT